MVPAPEIYIEPWSNSARGATNPIIYLTRLLNKDIMSKKKNKSAKCDATCGR